MAWSLMQCCSEVSSHEARNLSVDSPFDGFISIWIYVYMCVLVEDRRTLTILGSWSYRQLRTEQGPLECWELNGVLWNFSKCIPAEPSLWPLLMDL